MSKNFCTSQAEYGSGCTARLHGELFIFRRTAQRPGTRAVVGRMRPLPKMETWRKRGPHENHLSKLQNGVRHPKPGSEQGRPPAMVRRIVRPEVRVDEKGVDQTEGTRDGADYADNAGEGGSMTTNAESIKEYRIVPAKSQWHRIVVEGRNPKTRKWQKSITTEPDRMDFALAWIKSRGGIVSMEAQG